MKTIKFLSVATVLTVALTGCDILTVNNPNNLVQEDLEQPTAAGAVVNGALGTLTRGMARIAAPYSVVTDELTWIGSRDAWGSLDQGFIADPNNEFSDAAFPFFAEGRWVANLAVSQVESFVADDPGNTDLAFQLARAQFFAGLAYTQIGMVMEDFALSDRKEGAPAIGSANMTSMFDQAITWLTAAIAGAQAEGDADLEVQAMAVRAVAQHQRGVRVVLTPRGSTPANPLVNDAGAITDAQAVLAMIGGTDWVYQVEFNSGLTSNVGFQVNERGELQFEYENNILIEVDPEDVSGFVDVLVTDPVDAGTVSPIATRIISDFVGASDQGALTIVSEREMHLILAEAALAGGTTGATFADHINDLRGLDTGLSAYGGTPADVVMLEESRKQNLMIQLRRLQDMYRFGSTDARWLPNADAMTNPGQMVPITKVELDSNTNLGGGG